MQPTPSDSIIDPNMDLETRPAAGSTITPYVEGDIQELSEKWNEIQNPNILAPPSRIHNHFEAMGMALFHMGSTVLDYDLIITGIPLRDFGESPKQLTERYLWAEASARSAQAFLYRATQLGYQDEEYQLGPEVKKYCRQAKTWLTQKRQEAAIKMGIDPPPMVDEDVLTDQLDYDHNTLKKAGYTNYNIDDVIQ